MENYLISIIVPAFNIEQHIENTINSIINQTYTNIEIIVINDGSTDTTGSIIEKLASIDKRIIPIHKDNGGVTSARLTGISAARGDYIGFVDGDDYIEPTMYEHLLDNAIKNDADISHCGYQMVFPSRIDYYFNTGKKVLQDNLQGQKDLLEGRFVEPGLWNKIYKRYLFDDISGFINTNIRINEDLLMNFYLFNKSKRSIYEDICPYHYILRKGSASSSIINEHKLKNPLDVLKIIFFKVSNVPDLRNLVLERIIHRMITVSAMHTFDNHQLIKPYRSKIRKEMRKNLFFLLRERINIKLKLSAVWVSIWPWSYSFTHDVYSKIRGLDKKYDIK